MKRQEVHCDLKIAFDKHVSDCLPSHGISIGINYSMQDNHVLQFESMDNRILFENLFLFDSKMPEILAYMLLHCTPNGTSKMTDAVKQLIQDDPLDVCHALFYKRKIQELLLALALGVRLTDEWDGSLPNTWLITGKDAVGETRTFSPVSRATFEDYLLDNSFLSA